MFIPISKMQLRGPGGITLTLDAKEVYPHDPGNGCPALVETDKGGGSYWCATDTGTLQGNRGQPIDIPLTAAQCAWLEQQADTVDTFVMEWTRRKR